MIIISLKCFYRLKFLKYALIKMKFTLNILLLVCFNGLIFGQNISDNITEKASNWEFDVTPYLWFSSIKGNVSFLDQTVPVNAEFKDLIDQLSFGVMLHGEAHKGPWTILTDVVYLKLKEEGSIRNSSQSVSTEVEQIIWELGAGYRIIKLEDYLTIDGIFGMRYFGMKPEFAINERNVFDKSLNFIDPYVGMRFKSINGKWINRAGFDVGGFGIGSQVSWKLNLFVGYQISEPLSLYLGYRAYDVDFEENDSSFNYDVLTGGFLLGLNINL